MAADELLPDPLPSDPLPMFATWFSDARARNVQPNPDAMVVATVGENSAPSARVVLCKRLVPDQGFVVFFTNYDSRKGKEIEGNPQASLLFFWAEIERQVRIDGTASKAATEISDSYFATRPRESQIGAWISPQSEVIENRGILEKKYAEAVRRWEGKVIQRPPNWGGFVVKPEIFEFWQGRESRLHDRLVYTKAKTGWKIKRLAP